jgi:hypothetical protein
MRYFILFIAYVMIALFFGLLLLFPHRPATLMGFVTIAGVITPIVAIFDYLGQKIIESPGMARLRPVMALFAVGLFLGTVYVVLGFMGLETNSW